MSFGSVLGCPAGAGTQTVTGWTRTGYSGMKSHKHKISCILTKGIETREIQQNTSKKLACA